MHFGEVFFAHAVVGERAEPFVDALLRVVVDLASHLVREGAEAFSGVYAVEKYGAFFFVERGHEVGISISCPLMGAPTDHSVMIRPRASFIWKKPVPLYVPSFRLP